MSHRFQVRKFPTALLLAVVAVPAARSQTTLQIVTDSLPPGSTGTPYSQPIAYTPGTCSMQQNASHTDFATSSIDSGALPPGLSVVSPQNVEAWTIQGTPTISGTFQFTLHLTWHHVGVSPFNPDCTDSAVKVLSIAIQGPPAATLTLDRTQISTTYHIAHFPPLSETVHVSSAGTAPANFTVQSSTNSGGTWLSASPLSGVTPGTLTVSFNISGLAAGVYTGTVAVTSGSSAPATVAVTLTVVADTGIVLQVQPASLTFSYITGGTAPPPQSLAVTASGDSVIFTSDLSAPPNGKWLSMSPAGAATPASLSVKVDPKDLAPGTYNGTITLRLPGLTTIAQTVPVTFNVQSAAVQPAISATGVVNAASSGGAIAPGTWVSIFGTNLSATTRTWRTSDFVNLQLPTVLDNVSVTIDGKPAPVAYVSLTQINALAPDSTNTGLVFVQVKTPAGTTNSALVLEQTAAPAFFQFRAPSAVYVAGTHADGSPLAGPPLVQQGILGTPAKPGETIVLYGTGFGATQPPVSASSLVSVPAPLANPQDLRVRIGGVDCAIAFAGLVAPGLYQFNVVVPQVADGDRTVTAELRGLATLADLLLTIQH